MQVLTCPEGQLNTTTGECAAPVWIEAPGLFPEMTAEEGLLIGSAIVGAWAIGFGARLIIRSVKG